MNFAGWVPIRRGILEHTMTGALSGTEFMVFTALVLLADKSTGRGTTNAAAIRTFLPGVGYDSAKRALLSLQQKGYIWRQITPQSKLVYPYWINRYEITDGPRKMLQTNLSEVFENGDIRAIKYDSSAPQTPLETALHTALHTPLQRPLNNNKDNNKDKDKDKTTPVIEGGEPKRIMETGIAIIAPDRAMAHSGDMVPDGSQPVPSSIDLRIEGLDDGFRDLKGQRVFFEEVNRRIAPLNLAWKGGDFFTLDSGIPIPHEEAYTHINSSERRAA
jgi:hypothetical protein